MSPAFFHAAVASALDSTMLVGPLLIYAVVRRSRRAYLACLALYGLVQLEQLVIFLPSVWSASGPARVWQGKTLELVTFLALARGLGLTSEQTGIRLPRSHRDGSVSGRAFAVGLLAGLLLSVSDLVRFAHGEWLPPWRTGLGVILFELTLPGLAEEVSYRGVLLGTLDACLGRPWKALGVELGFGAILSSLMFSLAHTVQFDRNWQLVLNFGPMLELFCFALVMCWLRYRWGSVWPGALAHNVNNGFAVSASALRRLLG